MNIFKAKTIVSATMVSLLAVLTAVGMAVTVLSSGDAGATTRLLASRTDHSRTARPPHAAADAAGKNTAAATSQLEVCKVAGDPILDNVSFPFIEGNWSGSFYRVVLAHCDAFTGWLWAKVLIRPGDDDPRRGGRLPWCARERCHAEL